MKKLTKSSKNKIVAGIFGGIGEYLEVDPTLLRLIGLFLFIFSGFVPFVLVYIVAVFIVPKTEEQIKIDAGKPAYKKGWFWVFLLMILFLMLPILAFIIFAFSSSSVTYEVGTEAVKEEAVTDMDRPNREEVITYLEQIGPEPEFGGSIFADYYEFQIKENEIFLWGYISEYFLEDSSVSQGTTVSRPYVIIFSDGEVDGYWMPREDNYMQSVRDRFPERLHDSVLNFHSERNEELDKLIQDVENRAKSRLNELN